MKKKKRKKMAATIYASSILQFALKKVAKQALRKKSL